jgi:hypothetical protein
MTWSNDTRRRRSFHKLATILLLCALVFSAAFSASAQSEEPLVVSPDLVAQLYQNTNETQSQFLYRVANTMRQETARTGYEVCGDLCSGPKGQGISVFTARSQVSCPVLRGCPLATPQMTNVFIHTHPEKTRVKLNEQDVSYINHGRTFFKKKVGRSLSVIPSRFSPEDYDIGPGYMVYGLRVYYQSGRGTQRLAFLLNQ